MQIDKGAQGCGFCALEETLSSLRAGLLFLTAVLFLNSVPASAQLSGPTDTEELRHQQQREEQERLRQQNAPDARLQKEKPEADTFDLPAEASCFQVKAIQIEGDKDGKFPWVRKYLAHYEGRCIGHEGINLILKRLTNQFIERGYVTTRVGVPEQDISSGTLRIVLIPGVIRSIHFADEGVRGYWQTAFPARAGELLNLRDTEQGLEQMKRVPYQDADIELKPGDLPGESDVVISVKRKKFWRGSLSLDDSGSLTTGRVQGTASLSLDNPLGINDLLSGSYSHDVNRQGKRGTYGENIYYSFPYGYWTSTITLNDSSYHQTVTGQVENFVYSGSNRSAGANVQRVVHRDQVSKTTLEGGLNKRWAKTYLNDTEILVQRRYTTEAEIGVYHRRYFGAATLDASLTHRQGIDWINAQPDTRDNNPDGPTTRYKIETLDLSLSEPFQVWDLPLRYSCHARGQNTKDKLLVSEQFSIGSRYTVRGFDGEQSLLAERGWYVRNDIALPLFKSTHEFYIGLDHGEVSGPSAELLAGRYLTGGVYGLRGSFHGDLSYDLFAGWPISKPDRLQTSQPAAGFQLTYQF